MKKLLRCVVAAFSLMSVSLLAAPVVQIKGGITTLILDPNLVAILQMCEVERIKPAVQRPDGSRWRFGVSGGVIDQDTYAGELEHSGGLTIQCGEEPDITRVSLQNLRLDNTGELPVLSAIVVVDDLPLERIELFTPSGEVESAVSNGGVIRLSGVQLKLTQAAADFLNELLPEEYDYEAATERVIGEAITRIKVLPSSLRGSGNGNNNNKDKDDHDDHDHGEHDHDEDEDEDEDD
jgi:hypothetical protein